ncbi:MAG: gliding motility-associated-like protein, partial [Flavobacteriales bacterium]
ATDESTSITGLVEGSYSIVWTLSNGTCLDDSDTIIVNIYDIPTVDAGIDQDICANYVGTLGAVAPVGTSTGVWSEDVAFGNPSAVAFTNVISESSDFTVTVEGQYQLIWTVSNGNCIADSDTVIINIYDQPIANAGLDEDLCNVYVTSFTGAALIGTSQGIWSNHPANAAGVIFADNTSPISGISGLIEGDYQFIWTLTNGSCTPVNDTVVINVYDPPVSDAGLDQQLCNTYTTILTGNNPIGTSTGMWSEDATSANPSVVVFGDATAFNSSISGLIEGTYSLVWTVSNGTCTPVTDTVLIDVYDTPVAIAGADIDLCNIYTSTLPGTVPVGTSTGFWTANPTATNPGSVIYVDSTDANTSISGLVEGTYSLLWTVENGNCLPNVDTLIINVYDQPIANAGIDIDTCNTTGALLQGNSPLGTASGLWSEDANVANPSVVVFTDATDESTSITGLVEGSYSIVWTLSNGTCLDDSDTIIVNIYDIPIADAGVDQDLCNTYTTGLTASPATGFSTGVWSEDATASNPSVVVFDDVTESLTNITGLQEGTYTLLWTVSNGNCTPVIDTVLINVFDQPVADADIDQDICSSYVGTLGAVAPVGTSTGVWSEDVAFGNPSAVAFTNVTSESSDFTVTVEGQYQLIWTVSNGNCIADSDTVIINIYDQPTANTGLDEDLCNVYTTAFTGAALLGTSQGIWSNHPANAAGVVFTDNSSPISGVSGLSEGDYQFIWTVSNGTCTPVSDIVDISVYDQPIANAGVDQDLCGIYTATLDANNPAGTSAGIWMLDNAAGPPSGVTFADASKFNTVVSGLEEGTYSLIWTIVNGTCPSASDTMVINVYDPPVANAGVDIFLCSETSAILDGNINVGLASGQWSLDPAYGYPSVTTFIDDLMYNTEINNLVVGDYPIIWTMQNGTCPHAQDTVWIFNQPLPLVSAVYPDEVCSNLCFDIQNTASAPIGETITNVTWTLDGTNYANNLENICLNTAGTYPLDLIITASNGCVDSLVGNSDIIINPTPLAGFEITPSDTLFELERVDIMNSASADVITWHYSTGDTTIVSEADFIHFYENEGVYELTQLVTNQFGCQDSTSFNVYVNERQTVFVPNSFTPGDPDGINDYFGPVARAILDVDYEFLIFNRWGELLFFSSVYGENWDGTHQGQLVPRDSYVWKLSYRFENSSLIQTQMGHVIVVR